MLKAVTISERWDKKAAKFNAAVLPYPHTSKESFERSMQQPLGPDFNTTTSFRQGLQSISRVSNTISISQALLLSDRIYLDPAIC